MAHKVTSPAELVAFAEQHGWTVSEYLPAAFDACASKDFVSGTVIVTRDAKTRKWMWTLDRHRNWGKGNRLGRSESLLTAVATALAVAADEDGVLFTA